MSERAPPVGQAWSFKNVPFAPSSRESRRLGHHHWTAAPEDLRASGGPTIPSRRTAAHVGLENGDGLGRTPPFTGCPLTVVRAPLKAAGRCRSPVTLAGYLAGRPPRNKGLRYPPDPPTVAEILGVMCASPATASTASPVRQRRSLL
jgi:hypothetical protein